jgi:hypothetical protein
MPIDENVTQEDRDAASRMRDAVNLQVLAIRAEGARDRPGFVALRLEDGRTADGNTLYDTRRDAVRHHLNDTNVFYLKIGRDTMTDKEAIVVLMYNRQARANGVIFAEEDIIMPHMRELLMRANLRSPLIGEPE